MTTEPEDIESEEEEADDDFEGGVFLYLIGKGRVDLAEWCKTYKPERVAKLGLVP